MTEPKFNIINRNDDNTYPEDYSTCIVIDNLKKQYKALFTVGQDVLGKKPYKTWSIIEYFDGHGYKIVDSFNDYDGNIVSWCYFSLS